MILLVKKSVKSQQRTYIWRIFFGEYWSKCPLYFKSSIIITRIGHIVEIIGVLCFCNTNWWNWDWLMIWLEIFYAQGGKQGILRAIDIFFSPWLSQMDLINIASQTLKRRIDAFYSEIIMVVLIGWHLMCGVTLIETPSVIYFVKDNNCWFSFFNVLKKLFFFHSSESLFIPVNSY